MFVSPADFEVVPYAIPSQSGDGVNDSLPPFIEQAEKTNLSDLLGFILYDALVEALPDSYNAEKDYQVNEEVLVEGVIYRSLQTPNLDNPITDNAFWQAQPANKWTKLLNGETYTNSAGKLNKWVGLKELCRPLVFAEYLLNFNDYLSAMGIVIAVPENSTRTDAGVKASQAWNSYAKTACGNTKSFSEVNSLYGYLLSVKADFDVEVTDKGYVDFEEYLNDNFVHPGQMNIFNL